MIDLSNLKAGDRVEVNGELLPVIKIIFCPKDNIVEYDLYKVFILDDSKHGYSDYCYRIDGSFLFGFYPITKVVRQWDDEDMKAAYSGLGETPMNFDSWLDQYKANK